MPMTPIVSSDASPRGPLLATKLYIPPARASLVPRPRLTERLDEAFGAGCRLTLLSASAGFGKTTLLSEWIDERQPSVAWVSLDEGDNDPARFWTYVIAALETLRPGMGANAQAMLSSPQPLPLELVLTTLINQVAAIPNDLALVLDDYHVIEASPIHKSITFLLDHLPPRAHLIIATRADPPLPLARWRARGQMLEIRTADLRCTPDEAAAFLNHAMGLQLSAEDIATLGARTEGWIAGLQMAALSIQTQKDIPAFIKTFTGSHHYILDYLIEEVLHQQPELTQTFLLQTSILDRLTGTLCDTVAGQRDSQARLQALEEANLFIVPLDAERRWYRYHRLFADLLRYRLQQSVEATHVAALHRRAAEWYAQNGLTTEAVRHLLAAGDFQTAAQLIEQIGPMLFWMRGEIATVLGWLNALPEELVRARPRLCLLHAWVLMTAIQFDAVQVRLRDAENAIRQGSAAEREELSGELAVLRVMLANFRGDPHIIELCHQALERLPEDAWFLRATILGNLGGAYSTRGEVVAAGQAFAETSRLSQIAGHTFLTLGGLSFLGDVQVIQGQLHRAAQTYQQVLERAAEQGGQQLPFTGMADVGMGVVLCEWNDLDIATRHLMKGIELGEQQGDVIVGPELMMLATGYVAFARVLRARGDFDGALELIQKAETLARKHDPLQVPRIMAARARLWIAQENWDAVARWVQKSGLSADDEPSYPREYEHLTLARTLIPRGKANKAMKLLERLRQAAESAGRMGTVIEILTLQALTLHAQDKTQESMTTLEHALSLAEPEGYVRLFVDEGEPMAQLLRYVLPRAVAPNYVSQLLAAFGAEEQRSREAKKVLPLRPSPPAPRLAEPLSERELQVLRLITDGLSNREIAEKLVVTVTTAKKHVSNILGKLGVTSRTQAVARARELGLI